MGSGSERTVRKLVAMNRRGKSIPGSGASEGKGRFFPLATAKALSAPSEDPSAVAKLSRPSLAPTAVPRDCARHPCPEEAPLESRARIAFVTISDRASRGEYEDLGGPEMQRVIGLYLSSPWEAVPVVIPDEQELIEATLKQLIDEAGCCLVLTTGGTGPAVRDVTPEATRAVCSKILDGFGELMRAVSLTKVPTAILSRQIAGIRGRALIINLPGKPKAIRECLDAVFPAVPYCIDLLEGPYLTTAEEVIRAFRPAAK